jgi:methylthioribose-1-phosphate isomerase
MSPIVSMLFAEDKLQLLDQRWLPRKQVSFVCSTHVDCEFAIKDMVVRGAPAIGVAAAYGVALAAREYGALAPGEFRSRMSAAMDRLAAARPTAVNLMWAIARMRALFESMSESSPGEAYATLKAEADTIFREEAQKCERLSALGAELVPEGARILTHCNTGSLAVPGPGTALGIVKVAYRSGKRVSVYADETRPRLQGARLTAWELAQEGIPATLIADGVAATLLRDGKVDLVVVGADRIAANGDTANKIGTFGLSLAAARFGVPFYVAAPVSTIDFDCPSGGHIEIEERSPDEVTTIEGVRIAPEGIAVYNPAFDVTPAEQISAIVTERGILRPPYRDSIGKLR